MPRREALDREHVIGLGGSHRGRLRIGLCFLDPRPQTLEERAMGYCASATVPVDTTVT